MEILSNPEVIAINQGQISIKKKSFLATVFFLNLLLLKHLFLSNEQCDADPLGVQGKKVRKYDNEIEVCSIIIATTKNHQQIFIPN